MIFYDSPDTITAAIADPQISDDFGDLGAGNFFMTNAVGFFRFQYDP
jgi:hypothetical protein